MKTLILVRHGKSSWEYAVGDKDRPLLPRGINDAILVANDFNTHMKAIDAVFSSPANRALHTSMIFLRQLYISEDKFNLASELYDFSGNHVLSFLKDLDASLTTVAIFGHNHAFTYLANTLGNSYIENLPTSGLVQIEFDIEDWMLIQKGVTTKIIFPKQLKQL